MQPDGSYIRAEPGENGKVCSSQEIMWQECAGI